MADSRRLLESGDERLIETGDFRLLEPVDVSIPDADPYPITLTMREDKTATFHERFYLTFRERS
jgi:hypothetical protein